MSYTLVQNFSKVVIPPQPGKIKGLGQPAKHEHQSGFASLHQVMDAFMSIPPNNFLASTAEKQPESIYLENVFIHDPQQQVVAYARLTEDLDTVGIPSGLVLRINKDVISPEDFEKQTGFPLSTYPSYGMHKELYLLRKAADMIPKNRKRLFKVPSHLNIKTGRKRK